MALLCRCRKPAPFTPDVAVSIDDVFDRKVDMFDAHVSQMYEWLAWHAGELNQVPKDPAAGKAWLKKQRSDEPTPAVRKALAKWYGEAAAGQIKFAEAFELCEYGARPGPTELRRLFPFFPAQPK
jgi:hypothetical protein